MRYKAIPLAQRRRAGDRLSRVLEPEAWAEYDAGRGVCSNGAGFKVLASIDTAAKLMRRYPALVKIVNAEKGRRR